MTTKYKLMTSLAFSAAFLTAIATMPTARAEMYTSGAQIITNGPQTNPGDRSGSWSARQNVRDSERYEAVVHANSSFRANRVQKECGPINDPQLLVPQLASRVLASKGSRPYRAAATVITAKRSQFCVGTGRSCQRPVATPSGDIPLPKRP